MLRTSQPVWLSCSTLPSSAPCACSHRSVWCLRFVIVRRSKARPESTVESLDDAYVAELTMLAAEFGITHTGIAAAHVLQRARTELISRKSAGLHDTMQFTYKNPLRSTDPGAAVPGAKAVFVAARPYLDGDAPPEARSTGDAGNPVPGVAISAEVAGAVARYARADHYEPLRQGLRAVAAKLRSDGFRAVAFADDNSMVDREIAFEAGLGWFGKNANLLVSGAGSFFVLGSVVTTAPLPVAVATAADGCGPCRRCLDGCPTAAIVAPGVVDASRCLAWLLQKPGIFDRRFRSALGNRLYGCDDCQEVCPPTVRLGARHALVDVHDSEPVVDVLDLLAAPDSVLVQRWGRWYLAGRDPRWLRRNALIIIGNSGASSNPLVVSTLIEYLTHHDPMLRSHAVWATRSLHLDTLLPADDPDADVLAELTAPL